MKHIPSHPASGACTRWICCLVLSAFAFSTNAFAQVAFSVTGMIDVTKPPYNATGNGSTDDTDAIEAAIRDIRDRWTIPNDKYSRTLYFPNNSTNHTYIITRPIVAQEQDNDNDPQTNDCGSHKGEGTIFMVGETNPGAGSPNLRPRIKVAPGTPLFSTGPTKTAIEIKSLNGPECAFRDGFRGIDIEISGNEYANGLKFDAAQDSVLEDVTVYATGANKGITAIPGRGMAAANIEVIGGKYGIDLSEAATSIGAVLVGVKLTDQTVAGLRTEAGRGIAVTGIKIKPALTATTAIVVGTNDADSGSVGHLALYDAYIDFTGNSSTDRVAVSNPKNRGISLVNVYSKNATKIVDNGEDNDVNQSKSFVHVTGYQHAYHQSSGPAITAAYRINGSTTSGHRSASTNNNTTSAPTDIVSRHLWDKTRSFSDSGAVPAFDPTLITSPSTTDVAGLIQATIDKSTNDNKTIVLPYGKWRIGKTITLKPHTKLIGTGGMRSVLKPTWGGTGSATFTVDTISNADATTLIQDISFDTPGTDDSTATTRVGGMHWMAGKKSMVRRVRMALHASQRETDKVNYKISGNGGGRWYSLAEHTNIPNDDDDNAINCNYRKLLITGNKPVTFYGLDIERGGTKKNRPGYPMVELKGAKDVRILGMKTEVDGSSNGDNSDPCPNNNSNKQPTDIGILLDINGSTSNVFINSIFATKLDTVAPIIKLTGSNFAKIGIANVYFLDEVDDDGHIMLHEGSANSGKIFRDRWLGWFQRGDVSHGNWSHTP